ncbi:MAG: hypothetical protein J3Q66DRAFT_364671 [Benniella sp.]|nr:MAG: hypothetical protein J3Q66DRAFT_364671 [Benniella sp.]
MQEAGIDGGGVFKEFLTSLVRQAFDTKYGLLKNTSDQFLYPNPHRFAQELTQLKHYEFLGRILGKALYEGILIDAAFAGLFLAKCLGQVNYLDDEEMGNTITRELIPNGSNVLVTRQNRIKYVYLTAHYRLNTQIDHPKWLWMFNQQELQIMFGGAQTIAHRPSAECGLFEL